ncbi:MAG: hypothetical protein ICV83_33880, partial [Cytophagales bacterium]|nr:hypothetical protein [Cytophagales bacterium]
QVRTGVVFGVTHLAGMSEEAAKAVASREAITPFDLGNGPLMRVYLVELAEERNLCILNIHHIVSDAWSIQILFNEVLTLYRAFRENQENPLPPLRIQYKDYAYWQQKQLAEHQQEHRQFFRKRFSRDIPVLNLPTDFARPRVKSSNGGIVSWPLDEETSAGIRQLGWNHNASLFMVLTALVKTLLFRYTGQPYLIVGAPIAARTHPDLENQIGLFVNLLALDTYVEEGESFRSLLQKVKAATLALYEHQTYPFDCLIDDLQVTRQESRSPLFDVIVQLQNVRVLDASAQPDELDIQPLAVDYPVCKYDLNFTFDEGSAGIAMLIEYNRDLFRESTIRQMGGNFAAIARAVTAGEASLLTRIELPASRQEEAEEDAFLRKMHEV